MKTFCIETLGCKVNHYESEQIASLLRARGLTETDPARADLRVVNTCSVTVEAAAKSRQTTRRLVRLPLLTPAASPTNSGLTPCPAPAHGGVVADVRTVTLVMGPTGASTANPVAPAHRPRLIVTGCWATSDPAAASALPGVDAVVTHHGDVAADLDRLLADWRKADAEQALARRELVQPLVPKVSLPQGLDRIDCSPHGARPGAFDGHGSRAPADTPIIQRTPTAESPPEPFGNEGWMIEAGSPAGARTDARTRTSKAESIGKVNAELDSRGRRRAHPAGHGTTRLPLLGERQAGRQRAVLKVQDGCDAHCTYCIIPTLRPIPWSKPVDEAVEEARRMVDAGHVEIVLTGIFLGAYGQATALRRRQPEPGPGPLGNLVDALCTRVPGLRRLRLSSLEPGDMTDGLLAVLRAHRQVVPHFHLPLQSGSDALLRRMNRQYGRDDFLRMVDSVRATFDRPALTTDIIAGFPGETDEEFRRTLEVVDHAGFVHVHAFPFSARPGTAAARWGDQFVPGPVVNERVEILRRRGEAHGLAFRRQFLGEVVEVLVEDSDERRSGGRDPDTRHGRCERYFDVHFDQPGARPGDFLRVRVDEVTPRRTRGACVGRAAAAGAGEAA